MKVSVNKKIIAYTAIFGLRDLVQDLQWTNTDIPFYCFTDQPTLSLPLPNITCVTAPKPSLSNAKSAKFYKHSPHLFFPDYEYSVWLDGNLRLKPNIAENLNTIVPDILWKSNFAALSHEHRNCSYEEGVVCRKLKLDSHDILSSQLSYYKNKGKFPLNAGLISAGFLIRRHNEEVVKEFESVWWGQILEFSCRDQVSFGYAVCKSLSAVWGENARFPYTFLPGTLDNNEYFVRLPHNA